MRPIVLLIAIFSHVLLFAQSLETKFERSKGTQTPTYHEIIAWWKLLDARSPVVKVLTMGATDAGFPLHLAIISTDRDFDPQSIRKKNKRIILINNGIHPGEPDGIDASILLARDIAEKKFRLPANVVLAIIPVYNIGGCLNRSAFYRVDQDGPEEFGFRGNSQNLDLNRDFIKCDSREARSFAGIFHFCDPDVFVDNHVSNGADYQHIMTLISSQHNKLGGSMGEFMNQRFEPGLNTLMKEKGYDLVPYVNSFTGTPENGWNEFLDGPRYSSGYATLWHTFAFVPETHMLKPYPQRVEATLKLMHCFIDFTSTNSEPIARLRKETKEAVKHQQSFPTNWMLNKNRSSEIDYKGYRAGMKPSEVSGLSRLYYDRSKPFTSRVTFFNFYEPVNQIEKPVAYIIPQGWQKVIHLLRVNKVKMTPLSRDTVIEVLAYRIEDYKSATRAYESHHINSDIRTSSTTRTMKFTKGDMLIPMNQYANRFIIEVLEPQAPDSYFAWNFFDGILSQKEGFSDYAFEDRAANMLKSDTGLKNKLDSRKKSDTAFASSAAAQLNFVYQNSPYFEPAYLQYPVFRVMKQ